MFAITMLFPIVLAGMVAQAQPAPPPMQAPPPMAPAAQPLESGTCLDSARPVPRVLQPPVARGSQLVRIDEVISTATMTPNQLIGFLYTTQDGAAWLGQRTADYMSPAGATAINRVLASTHMPGAKVSEFPPQSRYGVATKYQQFFKVSIPSTAFQALQIQIVPCVAWPASRPLPDPSM